MSVVAPTDPSIRVRGLRRVEYDRLVEGGAFEGETIELVGGVLVAVRPQGSRHAWVVTELGKALAFALRGRYVVREEKPLGLDDVSEPEPDIAVVEPTGPDAHPTTAAAVVEVSQSTQALDLGEKARRYAAAGIPVYWVVDLPGRRVVVHTEPSPEGYATTEVLSGGTAHLLGVAVDLDGLLP
jgi:Uma2 family endonuclease